MPLPLHLDPPRAWNILIGVTGKFSMVQLPLLLDYLKDVKVGGRRLKLRIIFARSSLDIMSIQNITGDFEMFTDEDEHSSWKKIPEPVLHTELMEWADVLVLTPLDASTLAKMATGLCDDLLTCVVRSWDRSKPLLFAPYLSTYKWNHPQTSMHLTMLQSLGYFEIPVKYLGFCHSRAIAEVKTVVRHLTQTLLDILLKTAKTQEASQNKVKKIASKGKPTL